MSLDTSLCSSVSSSSPKNPSFRDPEFLLSHARDVCLQFWVKSIRPSSGGLFHCLRNDGSVYDSQTRHLVSSTRLVVQFSWAIMNNLTPLPSPSPSWRELLDDCLRFLRQYHYRQETGGYSWIVKVDKDINATDETNSVSEETDHTNRAYGLCFVLLAYSMAYSAGVEDARTLIDEVTSTLTRRFWEDEYGLYADEASADWSKLDDYRGQNTNMHAVEAHMAAYKATKNPFHLSRARTIANSMCVRQAALVGEALPGCGNIIYEHYSNDWKNPDLDFNRDKPNDVFKPFGFQPGHLFEWSKLLVQLHELGAQEADGSPALWRLDTARLFFDTAMKGWDELHGGIVYSCYPSKDFKFCNTFKYKWVQAEAAAAAALLSSSSEIKTADQERYAAAYDKIWIFCWNHLVDHNHGSWFRLVGENLEHLDDLKCPPGKVDYHVTGLCYDAASAFKSRA